MLLRMTFCTTTWEKQLPGLDGATREEAIMACETLIKQDHFAPFAAYFELTGTSGEFIQAWEFNKLCLSRLSH